MSSGFLRCNQCIKTLHSSYQTALSYDFQLDLGGVRMLPQGDGLVKNRFQSVFLGPYGIPHPYKYQAKKILHFSFPNSKDNKELFLL
jgi:hypothetical protein